MKAQASDAFAVRFDADEDDSFGGFAAYVLRMETDALTPDDRRRLARAAKIYRTNEGRLSLEKCMGFKAATSHEWRLAQRNLWLARAAALMPVQGAWLPYARLQLEWSHFLAAGPWRLWRDDDTPPESATALEHCLFHASKHNRGRDLSPDAIRRAVCAVSGGNANA